MENEQVLPFGLPLIAGHVVREVVIVAVAVELKTLDCGGQHGVILPTGQGASGDGDVIVV